MLERTVRKSIVEVEQNHAAVLDLRDPYLQLPSCTRIVREHITEYGVRRSSKPPLVVRHCHQPDEQQPRAMGERSDLLVAPRLGFHGADTRSAHRFLSRWAAAARSHDGEHHDGSALLQREQSSPRAAADAWSWSRSKRRRADGLRPQIPQCSPPFSATYCS